MNKKKMENKGFTLVELIVVLVILAILAAILVPALLGYIDRAKEKQYVLNAKSALTATQAEFSSLYGEGSDVLGSDSKFPRSSTVAKTADTPKGSKFYVKIGGDASKGAVPDNHARYTVTDAVYVEGGYYLTYNGKSWVTTEGTFTPGTDYTLIYEVANTTTSNP